MKTGVMTLVSGANITESDKNYERLTKFKAVQSLTLLPPQKTFASESVIRNESYWNKFGELVENFIPCTKFTQNEKGDFVYIAGEYASISQINKPCLKNLSTN